MVLCAGWPGGEVEERGDVVGEAVGVVGIPGWREAGM